MKIAIICSVIPPFKDAVGEGALKLNRILCEAGFQSLVVTSSNQLDSDRVIRLVKKWKMFGILHLVKFLNRERFTLTIIEYPTPFYKKNIAVNFLPFLLKLIGIKTILYLHEYAVYSALGRIRLFSTLFFSNCIVCSDRINFELVKSNKILPAKKYLLSVGSNFKDDVFLKNYTPIILEDNNVVPILFFGFVMEGKGLDILLDFIESSNYDKKFFELHIVGGFPEIPKENEKELIHRINSISNVIYHGYVPDEQLFEKFSKSRIVFLPFHYGLSERRSSFLTAMAFGKVVVTTPPIYPIKGLVDGENVFYLKNLDRESIFHLLRNIYELENSVIEQIGRKARYWFFNNYSEKIFRKKIINIIYDTMIN